MSILPKGKQWIAHDKSGKNAAQRRMVQRAVGQIGARVWCAKCTKNPVFGDSSPLCEACLSEKWAPKPSDTRKIVVDRNANP